MKRLSRTRLRRIITRASVFVLLDGMAILCCGGCVLTSYHWVPTTVRVIDAQTGQPVADSKITIEYDGMLVVNPPQPQVATTDSNGFAEIKLSPKLTCCLTVGDERYYLFGPGPVYGAPPLSYRIEVPPKSR